MFHQTCFCGLYRHYRFSWKVSAFCFLPTFHKREVDVDRNSIQKVVEFRPEAHVDPIGDWSDVRELLLSFS